MKSASDWGFHPYKGHTPTPFDGHICIDSDEDSREHWAVMPVSQTRDSGPLDQSNFTQFLEGLGGESDTVEVHRFGHWGPGWYEIILVNPEDETAMQAAHDMARSLQDYPALDEEDLSAREYEEAQESWDNWAEWDVRKRLASLIESDLIDREVPDDEWPGDVEDLAAELLEKHVSEHGLPEYESGSDGAHFDIDEIAEAVFADNFAE